MAARLFSVKSKKIQTLLSILSTKSPVSVLLYGGPGTGKTEIAKAIALNLNKPLYSLNISDEDKDEDINERKRSLVTIQNHPMMEKGLILVDECDTLINNRINFSFFGQGRKSDDKAWINEYFDQISAKFSG